MLNSTVSWNWFANASDVIALGGGFSNILHACHFFCDIIDLFLKLFVFGAVYSSAFVKF